MSQPIIRQATMDRFKSNGKPDPRQRVDGYKFKCMLKKRPSSVVPVKPVKWKTSQDDYGMEVIER